MIGLDIRNISGFFSILQGKGAVNIDLPYGIIH